MSAGAGRRAGGGAAAVALAAVLTACAAFGGGSGETPDDDYESFTGPVTAPTVPIGGSPGGDSFWSQIAGGGARDDDAGEMPEASGGDLLRYAHVDLGHLEWTTVCEPADGGFRAEAVDEQGRPITVSRITRESGQPNTVLTVFYSSNLQDNLYWSTEVELWEPLDPGSIEVTVDDRAAVGHGYGLLRDDREHHYEFEFRFACDEVR
ncbi:MAG: hypothetical protein GXX90_04245 [Microbacteriaceae bacterium]|nr:hypothetical protein [Microbacteriaceae bacterium]